ncbi:MAG: hypothetical protein ACK4YP_11455 [Myxococcota bacterium]
MSQTQGETLPESTIPVASTRRPVHVEQAAVAVTLAPVAADDVAGRPSARPRREPRYLLRLEAIECAGHPGAYDVYLGLPPGARPEDHPDRLAGRVSLVGPRPTADRPVRRFDVVVDVSRQGQRLSAHPDDAVHVTLVPVYDWSDPLTIGTISLHIG